ncbi:V-set and transmembrane domain-containing protein 2-like protein [Megalops cyprinoides]|uniref:V-set and transmembrane domain-containing protein 2-like protein n=1 Tax=Megalops cyprinoides TaxID=118141 RepID=UPI0018647F10|nr:V-set and transmembrane domain-containing protein 2-like protein [Megalops cyprinoides]
MGTFGVLVGILHYAGLYIQLSASSRQGGHAEVENRISGNALFTEVPHDITTQSGRDVEMACSFRGAGSPSYSLEIQWWYIRNHKEWTDKQAWVTNQVVPQEEVSKDATKISVVKVAGSNISHKLRLSSVKPSDEGTYECRVIDFSDSKARHHRVRAYLQVEPERDAALRQSGTSAQPPGGLQPEHPKHSPAHSHHKAGRELKKRSADSANDCTDSSVL